MCGKREGVFLDEEDGAGGGGGCVRVVDGTDKEDPEGGSRTGGELKQTPTTQ